MKTHSSSVHNGGGLSVPQITDSPLDSSITGSRQATAVPLDLSVAGSRQALSAQTVSASNVNNQEVARAPVRGRAKYPGMESGKVFFSHWRWRRHQPVPTGEKKFVCPDKGCGKRFLFPGHLANHQRSHTGNLPYVCPDDEKQAARTSGVRTHQAADKAPNAPLWRGWT